MGIGPNPQSPNKKVNLFFLINVEINK